MLLLLVVELYWYRYGDEEFLMGEDLPLDFFAEEEELVSTLFFPYILAPPFVPVFLELFLIWIGLLAEEPPSAFCFALFPPPFRTTSYPN